MTLTTAPCFGLIYNELIATTQLDLLLIPTHVRSTLGSSLEVPSPAEPIREPVPSGEIWATIYKSLILND